MILKYILFVFLLVAFQLVDAQSSDVKKNSVNFELAGSGLLYSVNYDRLLVIDNKMRFSSTIGAWYIPLIEQVSEFEYMIGTTIGVNTLFGTQTHFAELGLNISYMNMKDTESSFYHTLYLPIRLGYRYQKDDGGLFFRASFLPIVAIIQDVDAEFLYPITPHFAIGVGYGF